MSQRQSIFTPTVSSEGFRTRIDIDSLLNKESAHDEKIEKQQVHSHLMPTLPTGLNLTENKLKIYTMQRNNALPVIGTFTPSPSFQKQRSSTNQTEPIQPPKEVDSSHSNRKYVCETCGKRFIRPSALSTHKNSHSGDKPFLCEYHGCDKKFSVHSNMKRHMRLHRQE